MKLYLRVLLTGTNQPPILKTTIVPSKHTHIFISGFIITQCVSYLCLVDKSMYTSQNNQRRVKLNSFANE